MSHRSLRMLVIIVLGLVPVPLRAGSAEGKNRYFDSDGVKIHYVVQGKADGEPVLLIHGFTGDIERNWTPVMDALAKDYKLIAMDCRGHGASDKPHDPKKYGVEMVKDAVRLLDHLKIKRAHVVGYSMGAGITLQMVLLHPERVRTAVLGGNGLPAPKSEKFYLAIAEALEQDKGFGPLVSALAPKGKPAPTDAQMKQISAFILKHNDPKALAAVMRGFAEGKSPSIAAVKAIKTPMSAVIGAEDPLKARVDELKALLPTLEVVVVPNADHISTLLRPEFVKAIKDFLDEHRGEK